MADRALKIPCFENLTISNRFPDSGISEENAPVGIEGGWTFKSLFYFDLSGIELPEIAAVN